MTAAEEGWDPVARDGRGVALSAGELCQRDRCWHRWLDHDHAFVARDSPEADWCMIVNGGFRCCCRGFVAGPEPVVAPSPFADPPPPEPARPGRHSDESDGWAAT